MLVLLWRLTILSPSKKSTKFCRTFFFLQKYFCPLKKKIITKYKEQLILNRRREILFDLIHASDLLHNTTSYARELIRINYQVDTITVCRLIAFITSCRVTLKHLALYARHNSQLFCRSQDSIRSLESVFLKDSYRVAVMIKTVRFSSFIKRRE